MADIYVSKMKLPDDTNTYHFKDGLAVKSITRSGTIFTATREDGTTFTFTQQDTDTKNTTGSTDTSSKIYLVGATSQAANPQTYSDNEVYTTSGTLTTNKIQVGGGSCTLEYNTSTASLDFIFS